MDFRGQRALGVVVAVALLSVLSLVAFFEFNGAVRNASAVEVVGVGVYWDYNCTRPVTRVYWGTLSPDAVKRVTVYLRNENASAIRFLCVRADGWSPLAASNYLKLSLNYYAETIGFNKTARAYLSLYVSDQIVGITTFAFNIVVYASQYFAGDVDHDGNVGPADMALFSRAYGKSSGEPKWNSNADFDFSGRVDAFDFTLLSINYGKSA